MTERSGSTGATRLSAALWGMTRSVRSETPPRLIAKLEDAPFYTRNHIGLTLGRAGLRSYPRKPVA